MATQLKHAVRLVVVLAAATYYRNPEVGEAFGCVFDGMAARYL